MIRKQKRGKPASLKRQADKLFSQVIRQEGKCERCGSTHFIQAAHIVGRKNGNLRFDLLNALCLCASCHRKAHDNPLEFIRWIERTYPERYEYLVENQNKIVKRKVDDWEKLVISLKQQLNGEI